MDDRNSAVAEDFNGACLAGAADDRAAASHTLQRAALGPALRVAPEPNGNVRCTARHAGFACRGPADHEGIHWNGALWWDGANADAPAAEPALVPTEAGDTMAEVLRGIERMIALRGAISICPAVEAGSFDETLARLATAVGVPVPEKWSALDGVRA